MNMTRLWQVIISQIAGIVAGLIIGVDGGDWDCRYGMRVVSLVSHCTLFTGSLTRKLYRKKILEMTLNVTQVTR